MMSSQFPDLVASAVAFCESLRHVNTETELTAAQADCLVELLQIAEQRINEALPAIREGVTRG